MNACTRRIALLGLVLAAPPAGGCAPLHSSTTIDIDLVNRVLLQPHWQKETDITDF